MKKQYIEPEEMIDHNGNLDTVSGLMSIFFAYNQKEADVFQCFIHMKNYDLGVLVNSLSSCKPKPLP